MYIYPFEKLEVWQLARKFRKEIYAIANQFPSEELFGLTIQIKRLVSSIGACLAEGSWKITCKEKAHYTNMAYSTALETLNYLIGSTFC